PKGWPPMPRALRWRRRACMARASRWAGCRWRAGWGRRRPRPALPWRWPDMIPGEIIPAAGEIVLNAGRPRLTLTVANTGDRPVQVGSHYHFAETNPALDFDRAAARGMRLDIAAGTAIRFEPGQT